MFWGVLVNAFDLSTQVADSLASGLSISAIFLVMVGGFLSALSPCIYPLIPITLSVMGARRYENRLMSFLVAGSYVLGMSMVYTLLGALFAFFGILSGSLMQNAAILWAIVAIFLFLALSMFGIFQLVLPSSLMIKLSSLGQEGLKGAFLMGLVAGIIAAPCTGPVLGFILTLVAREQNLGMGLFLMSSFSLGMGLPFLILGTFSSLLSHLPKAGRWMENIKYLLGTFMLSGAFYYASLAHPLPKAFLEILNNMGPELLMLNCLIAAILLLVELPFRHRRLSRMSAKIVGIILLSLSLAALVDSPKQEIKTAHQQSLAWHVIDHKTRAPAFEHMLEEARTMKKKVMIDFYADWCVACKKLSQSFNDPSLAQKLNDYFLIKVDASSATTYLNTIQTRFNVVGLPTIIFLNEWGALMPDATLLGSVKAKEFLRRLP